MKNNLEIITDWIEEDKQKIQVVGAKCIKGMDSSHLAKCVATGLRSAYGDKLVPLKKNGAFRQMVLKKPPKPPLTQTAGKIGALVMLGRDLPTDGEKKIRRRRIEIGLQLLKIMFQHGVLGYKRDTSIDDAVKKKDTYLKSIGVKAPKQDNARKRNILAFPYVVVTKDKKFMNELLMLINLDPIPNYAYPSVREIDERTQFYDGYGGQLVSRVVARLAPDFERDKCPLVYDVVNRMQSIPYEVNKGVLDVYEQLEDHPMFTLKNLKRGEGVSKKRFKEVKAGKLRETNEIFYRASLVRDEVFYEYHYLDFRGRVYPSPHFFNHAGSKMAKSLFLFHNKEPLGRDGWFWLLVGTANCYGYDKLPIEERYDKAESHLDEWMDIASDPVGNVDRWNYKPDGKGVDSPKEFLSHILEIKAAMDSGDEYSYESGLPIHLDATCSGLMIMASLSKDEVTAKMCNLLITNEVGDYYRDLGTEVWNKLDEDNDVAAWWMDREGKARVIVKRGGMTYLYSCGGKTMGRQILKDRMFDEGFEGIEYIHTSLLGDLIYESCVEIMPGPTALMELFIAMGISEFDKGRNLKLIAPYTKFPMTQNYQNDTKSIVKFRHLGKVIRLRYVSAKDASIKKTKVKSSSSPNIVHFLDAQLPAAITMKSMMAKKPYEVMTIHDSFATTPANTARLAKDIRVCFGDLYGGDVLRDLLSQIDREDLLDTIEIGNLDVEKNVMSNEICFS